VEFGSGKRNADGCGLNRDYGPTYTNMTMQNGFISWATVRVGRSSTIIPRIRPNELHL
jgi:hypothetical protein